MVTLTEIQQAHAKTKTGADFPNYIKEIKQMGVSAYEVFVTDGHTEFLVANGTRLSSAAKYGTLTVADEYDGTMFKTQLKAHQQGKTDYLTFCNSSAELGIDKWAVDTEKMTCTYFSKSGDTVLVELIPQ